MLTWSQEITLATDDMLPILVYIIVKSKCKSLHANLIFIQTFQSDFYSSLGISELLFHLANFQGALQVRYVLCISFLLDHDDEGMTEVNDFELYSLHLLAVH